MDIIKIIGIGFITLIVTIILKEYRKEYAIYAVIICGAIILLYSLNTVTSIVNFLEQISKNRSFNTDFISCLLKITGISILTEYAVSICKDSGESSIASKIDFGGKILIISMSIPIIGTTLESLIQILP